MRRLRDRFAGIPDLDARIVRPVLFSFRPRSRSRSTATTCCELRRQCRGACAETGGDAGAGRRRDHPAPRRAGGADRLRPRPAGALRPEHRRGGQPVRDKVQGFEATRFNLKDRRIPIVVRLQMDDRETVEDVRALIVNPGGERPIPLSAVADVTLGEGPSEVRRIDGRRVALVTRQHRRGFAERRRRSDRGRARTPHRLAGGDDLLHQRPERGVGAQPGAACGSPWR